MSPALGLPLVELGIGKMSPEANFSNARFLTVAEVAELMRVSKMTVYRLVHSGEMPAVRFGRSYRVPESAVEQYLKGAVVDRRTETG
jgi:excisionase family DNA binding protein